MPYIKAEDRIKYDQHVDALVNALIEERKGEASVGEVNYVISSLIWKLFNHKTSYTTGNNLVGVLECVKQEFYRRPLATYEDEKIKSNGDIV